MNGSVHGVAPGITEITMIGVAERFTAAANTSTTILQVHHLFNSSVIAKARDRLLNIVTHAMNNASTLSVPPEADWGEGSRRRDAN